MKYLLLLLLPVAMISCQKGVPGTENTSAEINCDLLKQGITEKKVSIITESLGQLLNKQYSNESLNELATAISSGCDMTAILECFDCIKTNPAQSEMSVSFVVGDPFYKFVLDLAPSTDNTIKVMSVE